MRLAAVTLPYRLKLPRDKRSEAERALEHYERNCPLYQSIRQGFDVSWSADIQEG